MNEVVSDESERKVRDDTGRASEPVIRITDLRKTFDNGSIVACEDVNLSINNEDFVVLLGPSGCGKTTTLRCISGLELPDSGEVIIDGIDMTGVKPKDRNLAFVFQSVALFPHKSVRGNLQFGLDMSTKLSKAEKKERVEDIAKMLGIEDKLDQKPSSLSGGQQQRVSLGRAMVMEPAAFLLDEPFSALDAKLRKRMQTEIKELQGRLETPMVFVTHDQEEAMAIGDRIVIMDGGIIQQIGSPYEVFNEPVNQFVAEFIGSPSVNAIESRLSRSPDGFVLENDLFSLPLDAELPAALTDGEPVTFAIRPQYIHVAQPGEELFSGTVKLVEPQGDRDTIYLDVEGREIRAVVPQNTVTPEQEALSLTIEQDKFWIFDESGGRLH
ncbi:ABC transporter ATP-binding protein [Halogeometricum sp. S1BR25-6]|uniref:ABC transporter ATP-binding protein n=1 Tax=Halogeometricum salsisoli TaxID=2950536 RepID=A0ABU2GHA9_9EURY|nr:ABC transporter ATP-binding protein [Halogeometricum sp. S1BR25-6]MDS0300181.1 ABC transporter ATP-binding protein [Halogeometricum sp. S1BR25-6]